MSHREIALPQDAAEALALLKETSKGQAVVVFKKSPICPVSFHAETEYRSWLEERGEGAEVVVAEIDVIAEKPLARGLTAELGIAHQSPQALIFREGELGWHGSHEALTEERFRAEAG